MKLDYTQNKGILHLSLNGNCLAYDDETVKAGLYEAAARPLVKQIVVSAENMQKWDSTLVVVLCELVRISRRRKIKYDFSALPEHLQRLIDLAFSVDRKPTHGEENSLSLLEAMGTWGMDVSRGALKGLHFMGESLRSLGRMLLSKAVFRKVDFLFALEDSSYRAVGIVSLVSFMVGLILAFVGAIQLKNFGAQIYVASLVAIGMTRIMGAIMAGVVVSGRTGASYAATIGTMQVNEEIDALKTMGIPITDFLVLPRMSSLIISMPFITLLADVMGIIGGGTVGVLMLGISPEEYVKYTLDALSMKNFLVGIFHGFVYGFVIAVCGCYYGVNCGRNADSVGVATTRAVVSSIVWMIVVTGIITAAMEALGI